MQGEGTKGAVQRPGRLQPNGAGFPKAPVRSPQRHGGGRFLDQLQVTRCQRFFTRTHDRIGPPGRPTGLPTNLGCILRNQGSGQPIATLHHGRIGIVRRKQRIPVEHPGPARALHPPGAYSGGSGIRQRRLEQLHCPKRAVDRLQVLARELSAHHAQGTHYFASDLGRAVDFRMRQSAIQHQG